ncbi:MAG: iron-sulfur cluster repair di-iron protein [Bacteroidales bacterium]|nr:iron-sulfur cluster repair di-iron protein [Bacteroidales bacterium]
MEINASTIVGEIVRSNFKTAQLFEKKGIDFCCGGNIALSEACKKSNLEIDDFIPEIEAILEMSDPDSKFIEQLELDALCDYIEKRHHSYVSENIPFLLQKMQKLVDAHGKNHQELFKIKALFSETAGNLAMHMKKEELVLFPYIRKMVKFGQNGNYTVDDLGNILQPISQMELEHQAEGERFDRISNLTDGYSVPDDGCGTYQVTFKTLHEFEQDLHRHIHLENNILFKKAIALEKKLINKTE